MFAVPHLRAVVVALKLWHGVDLLLKYPCREALE